MYSSNATLLYFTLDTSYLQLYYAPLLRKKKDFHRDRVDAKHKRLKMVNLIKLHVMIHHILSIFPLFPLGQHQSAIAIRWLRGTRESYHRIMLRLSLESFITSNNEILLSSLLVISLLPKVMR